LLDGTGNDSENISNVLKLYRMMRKSGKTEPHQIVSYDPRHAGAAGIGAASSCIFSQASRLLFLQDDVTRLNQSVELLLLLGDARGRSFLVLRARSPGGLFSQLPEIVLQYRDAVVEFR
jgi:hypothetical protein